MGQDRLDQQTKDAIPSGYRETELGTVPSDWGINYVEEVANITTGGKNTQDRVEDGAYSFFVRSQKVERINSYSFDGEGVLTAGDGVGTGKIFHYIYGKCDIHQRVYLIYDFKKLLNGSYFYHYFAEHFYDRIMQMTAKSSVDSVRREMIARMPILLPPVKEQQAIAEALGDADGLIDGLEKLIAKKRLIKQGAMQELLTGKRRLPGFSGDWRECQFGQVVEIRNKKKQTYLNPIAERCIELEQIGQNTGDIEFFSDTRDRKSIKYVFEKGDVLFGRLRPYLRKYFQTPCDGVCSTEIWPLIPKNGAIDPKLLFQIVQTDNFIVAANSSYGTHMPRSDWKALAEYKISLPVDMVEQVAIGAALENLGKEIIAINLKLAKVRQIKQGMMQELLTGRIRLI